MDIDREIMRRVLSLWNVSPPNALALLARMYSFGHISENFWTFCFRLFGERTRDPDLRRRTIICYLGAGQPPPYFLFVDGIGPNI